MLKVPRPDVMRILRKLTELQQGLDKGDISSCDVKTLRGHAERWRLRVGDFRVVYSVEEGRLIVWVVGVGNRRDVYRNL